MRAQSYFSLAPELLEAALPKCVELTDEDRVKIRLPDWRFEQMRGEILKLYRDLDIRYIPLDPLSMAQALGYGPIPYRAFGKMAYPKLKAASPDALTCWFRGKDVPIILFNDRQNAKRCAFTMMHEIAHARLGHREHSKLAEIEANFFAANALCPLPLLYRSGLVAAVDIAMHFGVSEECAQHRIADLGKWKSLPDSIRNNDFSTEVCRQLRMKIPIQQTLLKLEACS